MNYTVKSGDSISRIARDVLMNISLWPKIAAMNNLVSPYRVFPGQTLQLPDLPGAPGAMIPAPPMPKAVPESAPGGTDWITLAKKYWWVGLIGVAVFFGIPYVFPDKRSK